MKTIREKGNMNMYEACKVKEAMYSKLADMIKSLQQDIKSQTDYIAEKKDEIGRKLCEDETYKGSYTYDWDMASITEGEYKVKAYSDILAILEEGAENT